MYWKPLWIVQYVDVSIKSYVIYILTGITFVEFIDCTNIVMVKDFNGDLDIIDHQIVVQKWHCSLKSLWRKVKRTEKYFGLFLNTGSSRFTAHLFSANCLAADIFSFLNSVRNSLLCWQRMTMRTWGSDLQHQRQNNVQCSHPLCYCFSYI